MKFTNLKISRKCIFPIDNIAHVRWPKTFYHISVNFRNHGFCSVSKPRKPFFICRTGPTTTDYPNYVVIIKNVDVVQLVSFVFAYESRL